MRSIRRSGRRWRDRGAAAVEMALILPLLMVVVAGIVDFGRYFLQEIQLTNAAREGARVAVIGEPDVLARVEAAAPGIPGLTMTSTPCAGAGSTVEITVTDPDFEWIILEPMLGLFPGSVTLPDATSTAAMRCEA